MGVLSKITCGMSLNDQEITQILHALHAVFPEDLHIARLLIRDLQQHGDVEEVRNTALGMARRMVSHGKAGHASGFLELCRQLGHGDDADIEALSSLAGFSEDMGSPESAEGGSFELIEQLSDQEAMDFLCRGRLCRINEGSEVVRQGEVESTFHLILEGSMRVEMDSGEHQRVTLGRLDAGRFFGEVACVYRLPRSATVIATEPSLVLEFSALTINQLIQRSPLAGDALLRVIQARMVSAMSHSHPAMGEIPNDDRQWLVEKSELLEFDDKAVIVRQHEMGRQWYILVHGKANASIRRASGEKISVPLGSGAIFGDLSLNIGLPPHSEVTASGRCLVCHLPEEIFHSFINTYEGFDRWIRQQGREHIEQWKQVTGANSGVPN